MSFVETGLQRILLAFILVFLNSPSLAQESNQELASIQREWSDVQAKLDEAELALKSSDGDIAAKQQTFRSLVDQSKEIISKLKEVAQARLQKDLSDKSALRVLLGIMLNEANAGNDREVMQLGDELISKGINPQYFEIAAKTDRLSTPAREIFDELLLRQEEALANDLPRVKLVTSKGDIVIELFENEAPNTVANFVFLAEQGYFDKRIFHRVIEGFMAQGGSYLVKKDPNGEKGPGYEVPCECDEIDRRQHFTGSISMANRGPDTNGSQFFLTFERTSGLDDKHTCFGRVVEGMEILDAITRTHISAVKTGTGRDEPIPGAVEDKILNAIVVRKRDHEYFPESTAGKVIKALPETDSASKLSEETDKKGDK